MVGESRDHRDLRVLHSRGVVQHYYEFPASNRLVGNVHAVQHRIEPVDRHYVSCHFPPSIVPAALDLGHNLAPGLGGHPGDHGGLSQSNALVFPLVAGLVR